MADTRKKKLQMVLEAMEAAKNPMSQQEMLDALINKTPPLGMMGQTPYAPGEAGMMQPPASRTMEYRSAVPSTPLTPDPTQQPVPIPTATGPGRMRNLQAVSPLYRMMQ